ncbi:MAG: glycosyltransferase family 2 protein [Chthoniobacterales bacterium]
MTPPPRVSIITATYNWSAVLHYAIGSALAQSFTDFEMLVIGDGCTDDSGEVVASFDDARLRWHNLLQNSGHQSTPNNAGLSLARGEFIAYLGHDDLWLPDHLTQLCAAMEERQADVSYSWTLLIFPPPSPLRVLNGANPSGKFEPDLRVPPSSLVHRRDLITEIGGWQDFRTLRDDPEVDLLRRAWTAGKKFAPVARVSVLKFNSALRPNSYVEKPSHEQAHYSARIRAEPDFLERELHVLAQSQITRHPEDALRSTPSASNSLGESVRQSRIVRGLELPFEPLLGTAPFAPAKIDFASPAAKNFLGLGWAQPETGFRWNDGTKATLIFRLFEPAPLLLKLCATPFLSEEKILQQTVRIILNGDLVSENVLHGSESALLEIELPSASLKRENRLNFEFPGAVSPSSLGLSIDTRQLALAVKWLELQRPVKGHES